MSKPAPRVFVSSGQPGYSSELSGDARRVQARKYERTVQVRFASEPDTIRTREGVVITRPGDAIITGTAGEHWRVSRKRFPDKYRPVTPTVAGQPGLYASLPYRVLAVQMSEPFEVILADGQSRLSGRSGDWLVDYGDGSLGVVAAAIFDTTYEIIA